MSNQTVTILNFYFNGKHISGNSMIRTKLVDLMLLVDNQVDALSLYIAPKPV
ncbi:MAG TPA: hypothetical protein VK184_14365 [Nostocaceae cyanobacterium]|nr:hypothetical protein [Nostocaceae cyanobacterium]